MNPKVRSLISFAAGTAVGVASVFLFGGALYYLALLSVLVSLFLLAFSSSETNPVSRSLGWACLGLSAGVLAPYALLFMMYAG